MLEISWINLAAIGTLLALSTGLVVAAMKSVFLTEAKHKQLCSDNTAPVCAKIEQLRADLKAMEQKREEAKADRVRKDLWLAQTLRKIADKMDVEIKDMP
jgi:outer membrane murein-binding lipoprotein Lpp